MLAASLSLLFIILCYCCCCCFVGVNELFVVGGASLHIVPARRARAHVQTQGGCACVSE